MEVTCKHAVDGATVTLRGSELLADLPAALRFPPPACSDYEEPYGAYTLHVQRSEHGAYGTVLHGFLELPNGDWVDVATHGGGADHFAFYGDEEQLVSETLAEATKEYALVNDPSGCHKTWRYVIDELKARADARLDLSLGRLSLG